MKTGVGESAREAVGASGGRMRQGVRHVVTSARPRSKAGLAPCSILFVEPQDDDKRCLSSALLGASADWQIIRTASTESAVEIVQQRNISVVVFCLDRDSKATDAFLQTIHDHDPGIVRLTLVANSSGAALPPLPELAHQTLSADSAPEHVVTALERCASAWNRLQGNPSLQSLISTIDKIPTPPAIYFKVREEIDAPHSDSESIAAIISRDTALSAKILKLVNSGFFALPFSVSDLHQAITMLGSEIVLSLALSAHLFERLPLPGINLDDIWKHGFLVSAMAKRIAQDEGGKLLDVNASSVAGLLHDIGTLVMLVNFPDKYQLLLKENDGDEQALIALEEEQFGVSHPELGGLILELWCLPEEIVEAVAQHHSLGNDKEMSIAARSTMLSEWLVNAYSHGDGEPPAQDTEGFPDGISPEQVAAWWDACSELADKPLS